MEKVKACQNEKVVFFENLMWSYCHGIIFVYFKVKPSQQVNFCWPQKHIVGKKSEMYANRARMSLENFTGLY